MIIKSEGFKWFIKLFFSIGINIVLVFGISLLEYEIGFCQDPKRSFLRFLIIISYIVALALHSLIYKIKPMKKFGWIYMFISVLGMIPDVWHNIFMLIGI